MLLLYPANGPRDDRKYQEALRKRLLQFLIEGIDDGAEAIQHLKLVNVKTFEYWAASSWDEIPKESLVKA